MLFICIPDVKIPEYFRGFTPISVLARAIQRGYRYAGIYSCYAKSFAATQFPLALHRNEATIFKKMFTKYKKSI